MIKILGFPRKPGHKSSLKRPHTSASNIGPSVPWITPSSPWDSMANTKQSASSWFFSETVKVCAHGNDVIMIAMVSQITSLTIVHSTVYWRRRSKKTSKLRVTGLCEGNSPMTGEFPTQTTSNAENVSIRWRHHVPKCCFLVFPTPYPTCHWLLPGSLQSVGQVNTADRVFIDFNHVETDYSSRVLKKWITEGLW